MLTEVTSKEELESGVNKLSTDVISLNNIIDNLKSSLNSITAYKDIDLSIKANTLASNIEALSTDIKISSDNMSSYVSNLLLIDQEETLPEPSSTQTTPTIPTYKPPVTNNTPVYEKQETHSHTNPTYYSQSPSNQEVKVLTATNVAASAAATYSTSTNNNQQPVAETNPMPAPTPAQNTGDGSVDISKYNNRPECGFNVTTGNMTFNLSNSDYDLLCSIVAAESDKSYDDALAVVTTILNRCEASNWVASYGTNPISQATAPNQFVVYQHGSYRSYTNGNAPDTVKQAVTDALNGVRNHKFLSFRSNGSKGYSSNQITATGNRYK